MIFLFIELKRFLCRDQHKAFFSQTHLGVGGSIALFYCEGVWRKRRSAGRAAVVSGVGGRIFTRLPRFPAASVKLANTAARSERVFVCVRATIRRKERAGINIREKNTPHLAGDR